jgi:hypothetical protein
MNVYIGVVGLLAMPAAIACRDHVKHGNYETRDLAPRPTESIGCVAHGDEWYCDGPRTTIRDLKATSMDRITTQVVVTRASPTPDVNHDHSNDNNRADGHDKKPEISSRRVATSWRLAP